MKKAAGCLLLSFSCLFLSCHTANKETLAGNWLIVYPQHQLTSEHQREVYAKYQDSIMKLFGLKLIVLGKDGAFTEMDSVQKPPGKWILTEDSLFKIREAGKGFNPFNTVFTDWQDDELLLTQYPLLEDEKIKIVWHLKKLEAGDVVANLFSQEANSWRTKPSTPQTADELRKRLSAMINYYANYFALIDKEASYFAPVRIPLPFHYYRHAIALKAEMPVAFLNLFSNESEATAAYQLLSQGIKALHGRFQRGENFVAEYSMFLKQLAEWLQLVIPA